MESMQKLLKMRNNNEIKNRKKWKKERKTTTTTTTKTKRQINWSCKLNSYQRTDVQFVVCVAWNACAWTLLYVATTMPIHRHTYTSITQRAGTHTCTNDDDTIMLWSSAHLCYPLAFHCVSVSARVCYKNNRCGCECSFVVRVSSTVIMLRRKYFSSVQLPHSLSHTAARCNGLCTLYTSHMYDNTTCCTCVCVEYVPVFGSNKERWKGSKVKWRCTTRVSVSVCALWPVQTCLCIMCFELMYVCDAVRWYCVWIIVVTMDVFTWCFSFTCTNGRQATTTGQFCMTILCVMHNTDRNVIRRRNAYTFWYIHLLVQPAVTDVHRSMPFAKRERERVATPSY